MLHYEKKNRLESLLLFSLPICINFKRFKKMYCYSNKYKILQFDVKLIKYVIGYLYYALCVKHRYESEERKAMTFFL